MRSTTKTFITTISDQVVDQHKRKKNNLISINSQSPGSFQHEEEYLGQNKFITFKQRKHELTLFHLSWDT